MANIDFKTIGQGRFQKTGPRSGKFFGPKHSGKGIKTVGPDGSMIEVEGGESVGEVNTNMGRQPYIYSEYVKRHGGVSYADEFDRMVNSGAPQRELDMLAAEQDSRAKRTGGEVQVTPMQYGGVYNNLNNNTMNRYRRGGLPRYQGDEGGGTFHQYTGVGDDVGPAVQAQRDKVPERKTSFFERMINTILYPLNWGGQVITEGVGGLGESIVTGGTGPMSGSPEYEGLWSGTGQYGGVPSNLTNENVVGYGPQTNSRNFMEEGGPAIPIWPQGRYSNPGYQMRTSDIPDEIAPTENYTPPISEPVVGGRPSWLNNPGVKRTARLARPEDYANYGRAQSGGLTNRVMQYQGDVDTGAVEVPPNDWQTQYRDTMQGQTLPNDWQTQYRDTMQGQTLPDSAATGVAQQSSDIIQQMMDMLKFSGGGGVKSLPIENQANIRKEFETMTEAERQQWLNFMTSPGTTEQSPTRADPESELIERIMQQQGSQVPLGPESFQ